MTSLDTPLVTAAHPSLSNKRPSLVTTNRSSPMQHGAGKGTPSCEKCWAGDEGGNLRRYRWCALMQPAHGSLSWYKASGAKVSRRSPGVPIRTNRDSSSAMTKRPPPSMSPNTSSVGESKSRPPHDSLPQQLTVNPLQARIKAFAPTAEKPFVLGLPTGSSPEGVYRHLVQAHKTGDISFQHVVTFNMDEYVGLPREHPESYHSFMYRHFFSQVDVAPGHVHLLDGNAADLEAECLAYEERIRRAGGIELFLAGIGPDGHIAFNEPGSSLRSRTRVKTLADDTIRANSRFFGGELAAVPKMALTVGVQTVLEAREVVVIITGAHKALALQKCIEGGVNHMWTLSSLQLHAHALIVVDEDATLELQVKTVKYFKSIERVAAAQGFGQALPTAELVLRKRDSEQKAREAEAEEEVERGGIVVRGRGVDDGGGDERPDEARGLADDAEKDGPEGKCSIATYRLAVAIPWANEQPVEDLIDPDLPDVVEAKALRPDADHAPAIQQDDADGYGVEHGLGRQLIAFLHVPECQDAHALGGDADDEQVCELEGVVGDDGILQRADDGDGGVERVAEQEVADEVEERLPQLPDLRDGPPQLPEAGDDDVHARIRTRTAFLDNEPGNRNKKPDAAREGDEAMMRSKLATGATTAAPRSQYVHAQAPVVVRDRCIDVDAEQNPNDNGQDENFGDGLHDKRHVGQLVPFERVRLIVLRSRDLAIFELGRLLSHVRRVSRQARERGGPISQAQLDVRPEGAKIGIRAQNEKNDDLDGKGDAIAKQNDRVDGAIRAGERSDRIVVSRYLCVSEISKIHHDLQNIATRPSYQFGLLYPYHAQISFLEVSNFSSNWSGATGCSSSKSAPSFELSATIPLVGSSPAAATCARPGSGAAMMYTGKISDDTFRSQISRGEITTRLHKAVWQGSSAIDKIVSSHRNEISVTFAFSFRCTVESPARRGVASAKKLVRQMTNLSSGGVRKKIIPNDKNDKVAAVLYYCTSKVWHKLCRVMKLTSALVAAPCDRATTPSHPPDACHDFVPALSGEV
nr:glucosamine-6-phosphate isomerase 1 [Quercus suber]